MLISSSGGVHKVRTITGCHCSFLATLGTKQILCFLQHWLFKVNQFLFLWDIEFSSETDTPQHDASNVLTV